MESHENFSCRCNIDEAIRLSDIATVDILERARLCYRDARSEEHTSELQSLCYRDAYRSDCSEDVQWRCSRSLLSVYIMGFLSGARAVRERKIK